MQKIVVLGSKGMAGHIMAEYLDNIQDYEVIGIAREDGNYVNKQLDVTDFPALENYLKIVKPDIVINCIGVLVNQSNEDISTAILINSYLPNYLSALGRKVDYKLLHISTDCVFSGKVGQYGENAFRDGDDNYARTKALGEVINDTDLTIRTSIIGPELKNQGTGLLDWFLKQSGEVNGYTNAYWSGVTTLELAKATDHLIKQKIYGLYQFCPEQKISKYDLLKLISKTWNKTIKISPFNDYIADKSLKSTRSDFDYQKPEYESMLVALKQWMEAHPDYYSSYS